MYENFGPQVEGNEVTFQLFFPDNRKDPSQYTQGDLPDIRKIQVIGTFQEHIGQEDWDVTNAPEMNQGDYPSGLLYSFSTTLPDNFYKYKFYVTFNDGLTRLCNDPCTKYSGQDQNNQEYSGFVVGGNQVEDVKPIADRLPQKDLIIHEIMIDDFTEKLIDFNPNDPPKSRLDLVRDRIQYLKDLGINAVEFMPWTSVIGRNFGWGYNPFLFFSVEDRFTEIVNQANPEIVEKLNKLYRLKELIEALHAEGMHVIMDGVFNHADVNKQTQGVGFPYYWLYRNPENSPFIGRFAGEFGFVDFNFENKCTQEFIFDVCKYWLDKFQIDGIRLDFTLGYFIPGNDKGMPQLIKDLRSDFENNGRKNISLMIEHLTDNRYDAIDVTNKVGATGCWFDPFMYEAWRLGSSQRVDTKIMRPMDTHRNFAPGSTPVVYVENHDHGTIVNKIGGSRIAPDVRPNNWFKTQTYAIALLTLPGTILIHNGQEFGDEYFVPDTGANAPDRVSPRPVNWDKLNDDIGQRLFGIYKKLIEIRNNHPSLRSPNFYPSNYDENNTSFDSYGYGVDVARQIVIYRREGDGLNGQTENFVIVLNFSATEQITNIPFPSDGVWKDLLNDNQLYTVTEGQLINQTINSNWGRILYK